MRDDPCSQPLPGENRTTELSEGEMYDLSEFSEVSFAPPTLS